MKILAVDDDPELLPLISFALRQAGFLVLQARDGEGALRTVRSERPDLVILDVNLPGLDGFQVCRAIRDAGDTVPILLLTVRGEEQDLVHGLDQGADDYLTKPFSPRTLLARVRALLRRSGIEHERRHAVGDLELDEELQAVRLAGAERIRLTALEFRLVQILVSNAGRTVTAEQIIRHVWGGQGYIDRQHLKQLVHRVRQKLEPDPSAPRRVCTEAGVGYRLEVGSLDTPDARPSDGGPDTPEALPPGK